MAPKAPWTYISARQATRAFTPRQCRSKLFNNRPAPPLAALCDREAELLTRFLAPNPFSHRCLKVAKVAQNVIEERKDEIINAWKEHLGS
jgi:hypothetical protein